MAAEETQEVEGWLIGKRLGYGAFSFAHKVHRIDPATNQQRWACAKFTRHILDSEDHAQARREQQQREINIEVTALQQINNPYVVQLYDYKPHVQYETRNGDIVNCHLMVLELCQGGTLFDVLYYTGKFNEEMARTLFKQVVSGVEACHKQKIGHRDIKAQNIVLDQSYQCKLIDFGSSKRWQPRTQMTTVRVGTKGYQAPEMLLGMGYTYKVDVFSLGVLLFIMLARSIPFQEAKLDDKHFRIFAKGQYNKFWAKYKKLNLSNEVKDLLNGMLRYQPLERMKISDINKHAWMEGPIIPQEEMAPALQDLHAQSQSAHAEDNDRAMDRFDSLTGAIENARGENIVYPELPVWLRHMAFELPVEEDMDGDRFLQIAQLYVTEDLTGTVEYNQAEFELDATIQLRAKSGVSRASVQINIFGIEEEGRSFVVFRRKSVENDNDAAALFLQDKLRVLFAAFVSDED